MSIHGCAKLSQTSRSGLGRRTCEPLKNLRRGHAQRAVGLRAGGREADAMPGLVSKHPCSTKYRNALFLCRASHPPRRGALPREQLERRCVLLPIGHIHHLGSRGKGEATRECKCSLRPDKAGAPLGAHNGHAPRQVHDALLLLPLGGLQQRHNMDFAYGRPAEGPKSCWPKWRHPKRISP
jgi:hypothetical protein